jgi:hypothetical protein
MSRFYVCMLLLVLAPMALPLSGAPTATASAMPARAAPVTPNREFMGMSIRDPWYEFNTNPNYPNTANEAFQEEMGATLELAGVRWVRMEFHIPATISATEAISAEIEKNSYFIETVAPTHHLKILALLGFDLLRGTNPRALNDSHAVPSHYGGGVNQYMDSWLTRALMIADRYSDKIAAYEVLNEENRLPQYSPGGPAGDAISAAITARLLTKFYRFCKNIEPTGENHGCTNAKIILGGLHPRGTTSPTVISDAQYIRDIYDINNSASPFMSFKSNHPDIGYPVDGIGYHPYPEEIQPSLADVRINNRLPIIRQTLTDVGDPYKQFWITEVGYNVAYYKNTLAGQEPFLRDVYTSLKARQLTNSAGPEVANVFWFKYEDFPPTTGPNVQQWGIVHIPILADGGCEGGCYDPSGVPSFYRPSFWAYRELAGLPVYRALLPIISQ